MTIWRKETDLERLKSFSKNTLAEALGIELTEISDNYLIAKMPVDHRTHQPMGILHGGASIALAETVGSIAGNLVTDEEHYCVGLEVNGNHVRSVTCGDIYAKATPAHLGRTTQVWDIRITTPENKLVCVSRLTLAVLKKKA